MKPLPPPRTGQPRATYPIPGRHPDDSPSDLTAHVILEGTDAFNERFQRSMSKERKV